MGSNNIYFYLNNITEEDYLKQLEEMPAKTEQQQFYKQVLLEFYKNGFVDNCCVSNEFNYSLFKHFVVDICREYNFDDEFKKRHYKTLYDSFLVYIQNQKLNKH